MCFSLNGTYNVKAEAVIDPITRALITKQQLRWPAAKRWVVGHREKVLP